jgi:sec-independent protein translocase protein TatA
MGIGNPVHLIFIAAVALIVLGPKRLPELARSLGNGMREFRESMSEAVSDGDHTSESIVPPQAQLVAAPEPVTVVPADAVVVDPAAPERSPIAEQQPPAAVQATPVVQTTPVVQAAPAVQAPVQQAAPAVQAVAEQPPQSAAS